MGVTLKSTNDLCKMLSPEMLLSWTMWVKLLSEKLKPVFSMLNESKGVLRSRVSSKKGGDAEKSREKRDKVLDELNALGKKLDAEEAEVKISKLILENQKTLYPTWTLERIEKESLDDPNLYWLEPTTSFNINNDVEC
ncbi:unnamed protein product [Lactuca saligna]|uniref:Uncharacterized protein n=1 Tax=Lactuca saligna TaxID=75948 RepID=A0AA35Y511_LACSI|nr:unnamed protein product [Lactuca saligna]